MPISLVSTHSRPKAAARHYNMIDVKINNVSTHSRPKAAAIVFPLVALPLKVSTHSRPKAAAIKSGNCHNRSESFNTQPPEGGCRSSLCMPHSLKWFQHTAARRRLLFVRIRNSHNGKVSTHSRPKAAALACFTGCRP